MNILAMTILASIGALLWLWRRPLGRARIDWRGVLARLPLPMLALAASYGVYSFARLFVPDLVAVTQAAAFELTYIGLAVTRGLDADQRKRATLISVGAVVASIVYNTLAGWFHRQPGLLDAGGDIAWLMFAILHGAPLAWVAYLVADLLLHSQQTRRPAHRAKLARLLWRLRSEARQAAQSRAGLAASDAMLAQARAELDLARAELRSQGETLARAWEEVAEFRAGAEHWQQQAARNAEDAARAMRDAEQSYASESEALRESAQLRAENARVEAEAAQHLADLARQQETAARQTRELREYEQVLAQVRADLETARAASSLDVVAVARRLVALGEPLRQAAPLLGVNESTLRGRLKSATNGHAVET